MQEDEFEVPQRFGIYGKDVTDYGNETDETASIPPKIELHTPVWGNIRKGRQSTRNYGMINYRWLDFCVHFLVAFFLVALFNNSYTDNALLCVVLLNAIRVLSNLT